jgi:hypothetical protein
VSPQPKVSSPTPRTSTGSGLLSPGKKGSTAGKNTGGFSLAAMQAAIKAGPPADMIANGTASSPHAKKSLDELNKTPNPATKQSIAAAVAAGQAEATNVQPPASPVPSSPAPTPTTPATTTPGRGSGSARKQLHECNTLDTFNHLTEGGNIIFIDIRDSKTSNDGHLLAPHHINIPVSQQDVDNKVSLKEIEDRHKDQKLFGVKARAQRSLFVYGQVYHSLHSTSFTHFYIRALICICICLYIV